MQKEDNKQADFCCSSYFIQSSIFPLKVTQEVELAMKSLILHLRGGKTYSGCAKFDSAFNGYGLIIESRLDHLVIIQSNINVS